MAMVGLVLAVAGSAAMSGGDAAARSTRTTGAATPFTVFVQTMDSCKQALPGGAATLSGGGLTRTARAPAGRKESVVPTASWPLTRGSCRAVAAGCVSFTGLPAGTYTLVTSRTPPADRVRAAVRRRLRRRRPPDREHARPLRVPRGRGILRLPAVSVELCTPAVTGAKP
jgi:hypothetical protein